MWKPEGESGPRSSCSDVLSSQTENWLFQLSRNLTSLQLVAQWKPVLATFLADTFWTSGVITFLPATCSFVRLVVTLVLTGFGCVVFSGFPDAVAEQAPGHWPLQLAVLPGLLQQQAVQRALHAGTGQKAPGLQCHLLLCAPRYLLTLPAHLTVEPSTFSIP